MRKLLKTDIFKVSTFFLSLLRIQPRFFFTFSDRTISEMYRELVLIKKHQIDYSELFGTSVGCEVSTIIFQNLFYYNRQNYL